ncbi:MAG: formyltransferase [Desulfuromonadales bacterium]|nr:formyltransferase [Desulfuromonadales bacterium]
MNNIVICAYHNVGYRCIEELLRQGAEVSLIFTHEDSPTEEIWFQSVRELADSRGIPCLTSDINLPANVERVRALAPDFIFSFYYRTMIKQELLEIPKAGAANLHGSLLPRYRGRVPINWAVINGETETGATLHYMVAKPDAGDIIDQERIEIFFTDSAHDVFAKVTDAAVTLLSRAWPLLRAGTASRTPMDLTSGSYFGGRKPADGQISWKKNAREIYNLIRGVTHPYPGAFTYCEGTKVYIWQSWPTTGSGEPGQVVSHDPLLVGTGEGVLEIKMLQLEGEPEVTAQAFLKTRQTPITQFQEN